MSHISAVMHVHMLIHHLTSPLSLSLSSQNWFEVSLSTVHYFWLLLKLCAIIRSELHTHTHTHT